MDFGTNTVFYTMNPDTKLPDSFVSLTKPQFFLIRNNNKTRPTSLLEGNQPFGIRFIVFYLFTVLLDKEEKLAAVV